MPHISSSFSNPSAGVLEVSLSGTFYQGTYRDAGFPSTDGGLANILIRGYCGVAGAYSYLEPIDRYAPLSRLTLAYPGGVTWDFGTEEIAHQSPTSGIWSYGMSNLRMVCVLMKR